MFGCYFWCLLLQFGICCLCCWSCVSCWGKVVALGLSIVGCSVFVVILRWLWAPGGRWGGC